MSQSQAGRDTQPDQSTTLFEPLILNGDDGRYLLADTEEQAREYADEYFGPDEVRLTPVGWMHDVGWNRLDYERKRDFIEETGYASWWEGCTPPADEKPTKKCRRAWEVNYL